MGQTANSTHKPLAGERQPAKRVGIIGNSGVGKTTLLAMLSSVPLWSRDYYRKHWKGKIVDITALEGRRTFEDCKRRGHVRSSQRLTFVPLPETAISKESLQSFETKVSQQMERTRNHMIRNGFTYEANSWILPSIGGRGDVGSTVPLSVAGGEQPQLLVNFISESDLHKRLERYLQSKGKKARSHKIDEGTSAYLERLWTAVTPHGVQLKQEVAKYDKNPSSYQPPLKPVVKTVIDNTYLYYTRTADTDPDLLAELARIVALMQQIMPRANGTFVSNRTLLEALSICHDVGPWKQLLEAKKIDRKEAVGAMAACLEWVTLLVPNHLLLNLNIELLDTLGIDGHRYQRTQQCILEETLNSMIVMTNKQLGACSYLSDHLRTSPFFFNWMEAQLDPNVPDKPSLSVFHAMEQKLEMQFRMFDDGAHTCREQKLEMQFRMFDDGASTEDSSVEDDDHDSDESCNGSVDHSGEHQDEEHSSDACSDSIASVGEGSDYKTESEGDNAQDGSTDSDGSVSELEEEGKEQTHQHEDDEPEQPVGQALSLAHFWHWRDDVLSTLEDSVLATREHLRGEQGPLRWYLTQQREDRLTGEELDRAVDKLMASINVFHAAPLLGVSICEHIEMHKKGKETPTKLYNVIKLEQALDDTQLDFLLAALIGQSMQQRHEEAGARLAKIYSGMARAQCAYTLRAVWNSPTNSQPSTVKVQELVDTVVGPGSPLYRGVLEVLTTARQVILKPGIAEHFSDMQCSTLVKETAQRIIKRAEWAWRKQTVKGRRSLLSPECQWRHEQLNMVALVRSSIKKLPFENFVSDVIQDKLWHYMHTKIQEQFLTVFNTDSGNPEHADKVLRYFAFSTDLRTEFTRSFFRKVTARGKGLTNQFCRLLEEEWDLLSKTAEFRQEIEAVYDNVSLQADHLPGALMTALKNLLDRVYKSVFVGVNAHEEGLLLTRLRGQVNDLFYWLLDRKKEPVLKHIYRQYWLSRGTDPQQQMADINEQRNAVVEQIRPDKMLDIICNKHGADYQKMAFSTVLNTAIRLHNQLSHTPADVGLKLEHTDCNYQDGFNRVASSMSVDLQATNTWNNKSGVAAVLAQFLAPGPETFAKPTKTEVEVFVRHLHEYLRATTEAEATRPLPERPWSRAIAKEAGKNLNSESAVRAAVRRHLRGLVKKNWSIGSGHITYTDLAALVLVLQHVAGQSIQIELLSPAFPDVQPSPCRMVLGTARTEPRLQQDGSSSQCFAPPAASFKRSMCIAHCLSPASTSTKDATTEYKIVGLQQQQARTPQRRPAPLLPQLGGSSAKRARV